MSDGIVLPTHPLFNNLTGQRFGRLVVVSYAGRRSINRISYWLCKCDCGREHIACATNLKRGLRSCGCLRRERIKLAHGKGGTYIHRAWKAMIDRCTKPSKRSYQWYGARGIRVCDRWLDFTAFYEDMGDRPSPEHSLDRIDNNGDYEPSNCRWATRSEQGRNKRTNRVLEWNGESHPVCEWAEITGISHRIIRGRLASGWSVEKTLSLPPLHHRKAKGAIR